MKLVYSLWSVPQQFSLDHRIILSLSHLLAKRQYKRIELVTDQMGAELCSRMGLEFETVRLDLDRLDINPAAWAAGKMVAYAIQQEPFVHIDHDVFLFKALPDWAVRAPVLAQHDEEFFRYSGSLSRTRPDHIPRITMPPEQWHAYNTGVFGGTDLEFIRDYASTGLDLIRQCPDFDGWAMAVYEQAWLSRHAYDKGVRVELLLKSRDTEPEMLNEEATKLGYCHLMQQKQQHTCMARVRRRLQQEDPGLYERAVLAAPAAAR
jgi:uncharacterized protein YqgQ